MGRYVAITKVDEHIRVYGDLLTLSYGKPSSSSLIMDLCMAAC